MLMRDVMRMIKHRSSFYMVILLVTIGITLYMSFINLNIVVNTDLSEIIKAGITQQNLEEYLETSAIELTYGIDGGNLIEDSFFGGLSEYIWLCLWIAFIMGIAFWWLNGQKAREFAETIPIKRSVKELGQLVPLLIILLMNCVVGIGSSVIQLTYKNQQIMALEERFPALLQGKIAENLVTNANLMFLQQCGTLVLWLVGIFLVLYLCSLILKNRIAGLVIGLVITLGMSDYVWMLCDLFGVTDCQNVPMFLDTFDCYNLLINGVQPISPRMVVVALICYILLFGAILLQSRFTDLSKGKFCSNRIFEFLLVVNIGLVSAIVLYNSIVMICFRLYIPSGVEIAFARMISIIFALLVISVTWYIVCRNKTTVKKVGVTTLRTVRNSWFECRRKTYFIVMAILVITIFLVQNQNFVMYGYFFSDVFIPGDTWWVEMFHSMFTPGKYMQHNYTIAVVIIFLLVYKVIEFLLFGNRNSVAFTETLPVKRRTRFLTNVLKDSLLGVAGLLTMLVCNIMNLLYYEAHYHAGLYTLIPGLFTLFGMGVCYVIGLIGYLHFIDVIAAKRGMKLLCVPCFALLIMCTVGIFSGYEKLFFMKDMLLLIDFPYVFTNLGVSIVYLIAGILLLIAAFLLDGKRELSSDIFYFKSAAYAFSLAVSAIFAIVVLSGMQDGNKLLLWILLVLGSVVIFVYTAYCCMPEWKEFLSAKIIVKHK